MPFSWGDIGEYDYLRFRGLAPTYTQVLINGKRVPGNGPDREINMDRIPAEIIDRIEIVRSPSAEIDSQGVAGTINIILKDGASLQGGYFRAGVSRHSNGNDNPWTETKYKPNGYLSYGDDLEDFSYFVSAYYQERYNAKDKITNNYTDEHEWVETEDEWDNRDSKDTSLYVKFDIDLSDADRLILSSNYFNTDRKEEQYEFKHERDTAADPFDLYGIEHQIMDIDQKSLNVNAEYIHMFDSMNELSLGASYDKFEGSLRDYEAKVDDDYGDFIGDNTFAVVRDDWRLIKNIDAWPYIYTSELTETDDEEYKASIGYAIKSLESHKIKFGLQGQVKSRTTTYTIDEIDEGDVLDPYDDPTENHKIDENRLDAYIEDVWQINARNMLQIGGRLEYTDIEQESTVQSASNDYLFFNPSLHYKLAITDYDQMRFSVAQTLRRPSFQEMTPFEVEDDEDTYRGNPDLDPEKSLGFDLGYEHSFARQFGIFGINGFYRNIEDKIEEYKVGENDAGGNDYTYGNVGDGIVYGVEFDSSLPLTLIGMPSVNLFANYTYLDSEIDDIYSGETRGFLDQPKYVYNVGFNHTIRSWGFSYGASYQKRGKSTNEYVDETEVTSYDGNLEAYLEYKITDTLTFRLTGDNLLDADVTEEMTVYDSLEDKKAGIVDEYETQVERAGAMYMVTISGRF